MDLDNIKKTWQETDLKPDMDETKIRQMLSNSGQSAFNSLLRYESVGLIATIICLPLGYFMFSKYLAVCLTFILPTLLFVCWHIYKLRRLKKVDMATMSITEVSSHIYWYRKAILKEIIFGTIWFFAFFVMFGYYELVYDSVHFNRQLIILVIAVLIGLAVALIIYRTLYWNNIKKIESAIKEVEEFENNEND